MILPIPPLAQRDSRWSGQRLGTVNSTTIGSHGCVITSMCMIATYYGHKIWPNELDNILTDRGMYYDGNLFINGSITKIFPDVKFDKVTFCETTPAPVAEIKKYLDGGKPVVVALINQGIRHYVLVVGYEGDEIYVNDPWQGDRVAINDRWGDPSSKILQINFFSGPVPDLTVTDNTPESTASDQTVINLGGDLGFMEIQAIRSEISDLRRIRRNLETEVSNLRTEMSQRPSDSSIITDQTLINLGSQLGSLEVQAIRSEILDSRRVRSALETDLQNARLKIVELESAAQIAPAVSTDYGFADRLKSRKFILAVAASAIALANSTFNLGINEEQMLTTISPMLAFIGIEGLADAFDRGKLLTPNPTLQTFAQTLLPEKKVFYASSTPVNENNLHLPKDI